MYQMCFAHNFKTAFQYNWYILESYVFSCMFLKIFPEKIGFWYDSMSVSTDPVPS